MHNVRQPSRPRSVSAGWATVAVLSALASALATFLVLAGADAHPADAFRRRIGCSCSTAPHPAAPRDCGLADADTGPGAPRRGRRRRSPCANRRPFQPCGRVCRPFWWRSSRRSRSNAGLDPWFTGSIKDLMTIRSRSPAPTGSCSARTLARETQLMAADLNRAKVLYDADRNRLPRLHELPCGLPRLSARDDPRARRNGRRADRSRRSSRASRRRRRRILQEANSQEALCLFPRAAATSSASCLEARCPWRAYPLRRPRGRSARRRVPAGRRGGRRHLRGARTEEGRHPDRLRVDVRAHRADRAALGDLVRPELRQPARRADPPPDPRDRPGGDRQFLRSGAGPARARAISAISARPSTR